MLPSTQPTTPPRLLFPNVHPAPTPLCADVYIEGMELATWFGGSDATWASPKDQFTLFRNVKAFYDGPADVLARGASVAPSGPQEVVEEEIEAGP